MKVLTTDPSKCKMILACARACAKAVNKKEDPAFSAIKVERARSTGPESPPVFTFCDQCGECISVCPAGALTRAKSGIVLLRKDLCVACYMCVGFCPKGAMFRAEGQLEPFKCISCGNCVKACPSGALKMIEKSHEGLPR